MDRGGSDVRPMTPRVRNRSLAFGAVVALVVFAIGWMLFGFWQGLLFGLAAAPLAAVSLALRLTEGRW